ncbi:succinylglutamate desuccinylase [Paraferrimonas sedimenticola]|uniref:Succinylglutamate desuccinylase n=1 Tax=Paraferrimonas sedimenticola TaxID=375674 RepID=A0AA37RV44_9GAMM|nr:succinylglutamate desuccinylase [Paraferrimonas sedimenticola]GLP96245.1 succinylglutamate desuccinylase [Paraferrimonas sedimenticola]
MLSRDLDFLGWTLKQAKSKDYSESKTEMAKGWQALNPKLEVKLVGIGIIEFRPTQASAKDIVLSCGVHGNETAPIEICNDLVNQILAGTLECQHRLQVQFANLDAMLIGERFVEENLNRLFSGAHKGKTHKEAERARELELATRDFFEAMPFEWESGERQRCHYDLHTAIRDSAHPRFAIYPFRHGRPYRRSQLAFLNDCGVDTILLSEQPTTTYSYYSSHQFEADAFTVELGKVRPFGENDHSQFAMARETLTALVSQSDIEWQADAWKGMNLYQIHQVINKGHEDFRLAFDDDTANFSAYAQGEPLAFENGQAVPVLAKEERIVFPNAKVPVGQRALLTVVAADISERLTD